LGATSYASLKSASLKNAKPISVVLSVDARSHNLSQLYESSSGRTIGYQGYGVANTDPLPKASITTTELTQRLGELLKQGA
jgi:hypothetical protein